LNLGLLGCDPAVYDVVVTLKDFVHLASALFVGDLPDGLFILVALFVVVGAQEVGDLFFGVVVELQFEETFSQHVLFVHLFGCLF
jgi:hypothetical protein